MTKTTHRRRWNRARVRDWLWYSVLTSVIIMLLAVGHLFIAQHEFQQCIATYSAKDSAARNIRAEASANTINALVDQSKALAIVTDPKHQPASKADIADAIRAIAAVEPAQKAYNTSIADFPYPKYTCGGTKPGTKLPIHTSTPIPVPTETRNP